VTTTEGGCARGPRGREAGRVRRDGRGVAHLEKSIGEIQSGLRAAERQIEADARARIRKLQMDAGAQITAETPRTARSRAFSTRRPPWRRARGSG
jgi:hypothetical protein